MRWFRILRRRMELKNPGFKCPVCHLPLSLHDLDADGYTVCPVCSVVLQVVMSGGTPLPVVHDIEIKRAQPRLRSHSLSTHVTIGLLPVGLLFSAIAFYMNLVSAGNPAVFERLGYMLFVLSFVGSFLTFGSGYYDWWTRYRHRPYRQITSKIRLSILFFILGAGALLVRGCCCCGADPMSLTFAVFMGLQALMLVVVGVIGHIGGNLVFGK